MHIVMPQTLKQVGQASSPQCSEEHLDGSQGFAQGQKPVGCRTDLEPTHVIPPAAAPSRERGLASIAKEQEIEMAPGKAVSLPTSDRS